MDALAERRARSRRTAELLRIAMAGSVDDGKSTLIGRLLHDSKAIFEDQLAHIVETSRRRGDGHVNLALLTDGLRAEREQGITIDVAYRYFATPRRRFIIADTPGHEQYTRNMVTGASTAELSIVLIDARHGVVKQTRRHAFIASLLRIPHLVVCVNKMDRVGYDAEVFGEIAADMGDLCTDLEIPATTFIPISALEGDNVVRRSERMPWYGGPPLLRHLEEVVIAPRHACTGARFPVQWVIRPMSHAHHDYRGLAGQLAAGVLEPGMEVVVLPGGQRTRIAAIDFYGRELPLAVPPMSVTLRLADQLDVSRGDLIASPRQAPVCARELEADVCWMADRPLRAGDRCLLKHTTTTVRAVVSEIQHRVQVDTLAREPAGALALNDIGRVRVRTSGPVMADPYARSRATGSFILIDEAGNDTAGAGMVIGARAAP